MVPGARDIDSACKILESLSSTEFALPLVFRLPAALFINVAAVIEGTVPPLRSSSFGRGSLTFLDIGVFEAGLSLAFFAPDVV